MICANIRNLIDYSINNGLITKDDELVIRNMLMDALHVADWEEVTPDASSGSGSGSGSGSTSATFTVAK